MRLRQAAPVSHVHLGTRRERVVSTPIAFSGYWPTYDSITMTPSGNLGTQPSLFIAASASTVTSQMYEACITSDLEQDALADVHVME